MLYYIHKSIHRNVLLQSNKGVVHQHISRTFCGHEYERTCVLKIDSLKFGCFPRIVFYYIRWRNIEYLRLGIVHPLWLSSSSSFSWCLYFVDVEDTQKKDASKKRYNITKSTFFAVYNANAKGTHQFSWVEWIRLKSCIRCAEDIDLPPPADRSCAGEPENQPTTNDNLSMLRNNVVNYYHECDNTRKTVRFRCEHKS